MKIITPITKVPPVLRGLWKLQYAPIERAFQIAVNGPDMNEVGINNGKRYKAASIAVKMMVLDKLHANYVGETPTLI